MPELPNDVIRCLSNIMDEALKVRMAAQTIIEQVKIIQNSMSYNNYRKTGLPAALDNGYSGSAEVLAQAALHNTTLLLKALESLLPRVERPVKPNVE